MANEKRCMTALDPETLERVTQLRAKERRSESFMLAELVRKGLDVVEAQDAADATKAEA